MLATIIAYAVLILAAVIFAAGAATLVAMGVGIVRDIVGAIRPAPKPARIVATAPTRTLREFRADRRDWR